LSVRCFLLGFAFRELLRTSRTAMARDECGQLDDALEAAEMRQCGRGYAAVWPRRCGGVAAEMPRFGIGR